VIILANCWKRYLKIHIFKIDQWSKKMSSYILQRYLIVPYLTFCKVSIPRRYLRTKQKENNKCVHTTWFQTTFQTLDTELIFKTPKCDIDKVNFEALSHYFKSYRQPDNSKCILSPPHTSQHKYPETQWPYGTEIKLTLPRNFHCGCKKF